METAALSGSVKAAVESTLLRDGAELSNREIARRLGIDGWVVGKWRRRMEARGVIPQVTLRVGRDGRTFDVSDRLSYDSLGCALGHLQRTCGAAGDYGAETAKG
jgi:hypothetical protein